MHWFQDTIAAFGRQLGMANLAAGSDGALQLAVGDDTLIGIESAPMKAGEADADGLVFALRPIGLHQLSVLHRALEQAHLSQHPTLALQVGLRQSPHDHQLLAVVRIPSRSFTADQLSQAVDFLIRWLDDVLAPGDSHA
ncbi:MAG: hypothetical protein RI884_2233 [Pseudomonadota bacterium]